MGNSSNRKLNRLTSFNLQDVCLLFCFIMIIHLLLLTLLYKINKQANKMKLLEHLKQLKAHTDEITKKTILIEQNCLRYHE